MTDGPLVSITIATRDRKQELLAALASCAAQTYRPLEILVFDDASSDGTEAAVREYFPDVRYFREGTQRGIAAIRNRGLREARGRYVFSIDDDGYYTDPQTVAEAVDDLEQHPRAAVLALPFIEPLRADPPTAEPATEFQPLRSFVSCAYAVRRETALEAGGYREFFFYRGEERDLSIRLLNCGFEILYGRTEPVVHLYSPKRAWRQMFRFGVRNNLLFDWLNIPHPYALPRMAADAAQLIAYKLRLWHLPARIGYVLLGICACIRYAGQRRPVTRESYRLYRSLAAHGPAPWRGEPPPPAGSHS
jgi:GT2 family glycosyltransferase